MYKQITQYKIPSRPTIKSTRTSTKKGEQNPGGTVRSTQGRTFERETRKESQVEIYKITKPPIFLYGPHMKFQTSCINKILGALGEFYVQRSDRKGHN